MAPGSVSNEKHWNYWADLSLGPTTISEIVNKAFVVRPEVPDWETLQLGTTVGGPTAKLDIGLRAGFSPNPDLYETGFVVRPDHPGQPALRTEFGVVATEFHGALQNARLTPFAGWNFSLPKLLFSKNQSGLSIQPYVNTTFLLGWDADPVSFLKDLKADSPLPEIIRIGAGIRFTFGDHEHFEDRWSPERVASILGEEALLMYPAIATAFTMGAAQSVFVDFPYPEFQFLKQHQFPVELKPLRLGIERHEAWNTRLEDLEKADPEIIRKTLREAGNINASLGAFLGVIGGQMMAQDLSLFQAARDGEISGSIPWKIAAGKASLGAALLGLSLFKDSHPGNFPHFGGHSTEEIGALIKNPDPKKIKIVAEDFGNVGAAYVARVKDWGRDYRWRGAEYLGHSLLLQAGWETLWHARSQKSESTFALMSTLTGGLLLGSQLGYVTQVANDPETAEAYYNRARISGHLTLAGSTLLTLGLMTWLHSRGWDTF